MKKLSILSVAFLALSLASCKKDHTCTCTNTSTQAGSTTTTSEIVYVKAKKADAKRACVKTTDTNGSVTYTQDCKLS
ncbi:MAG: hypothetical protein V4677_08190 [Bacteroidota bacterium]